MAGLVYFFSAKAFSISAIIIAKIIYLSFLVSCTSGVAPIMWIFRVLSLLKLSIVFYISFSSVLGSMSGSVLGIELVLNLGSLSILFIVEN